MNIIVITIQIIVAILLGISILLQGGGSGLGSSWGGTGGSSFRTRRGVEKFLLYFSIILAIVFFIISLVSFLI